MANPVQLIIKLEKVCLFLTLTAIMLPLYTSVGFFDVTSFNVPMTGLIFLWIFRAMTAPGMSFRVNVWDFLLIFFGFWMFLSTVFKAPERLGQLMVWESGIVLGLYARRNFGRSFDFSFIFRFAVIALSLQVIVCALQFITRSSIGDIQRYFGRVEDLEAVETMGVQRFVGTFGAINVLGIWVVTLIPLVYAKYIQFYQRRRWLKKFFYLLLWLSGLLITVLIASRFNFIGALLVCLAMWFLHQLHLKKDFSLRLLIQGLNRWTILVLLLAVIAVCYYDKINTVVEDYTSLAVGRVEAVDNSFSTRWEQYKGAVLYLAKNPVLGTGYTCSDDIWSEVDVNKPIGDLIRPHNLFLILAVEGGLPALILFVWLIIRPLTVYLRNFKRLDVGHDGLMVSVAGYLFVNLVYMAGIIFMTWPLFMFLLGSFVASADKQPGIEYSG